jgi:hypothetical protein
MKRKSEIHYVRSRVTPMVPPELLKIVQREYKKSDSWKLNRIRELAAASTTPSHRESMPKELEQLLFPGRGRLRYESKRMWRR